MGAQSQIVPVQRRMFAVLLLFALLGFLGVQALHTHHGLSDDHCSLCLAAHSYSPVVVSSLAPVVLIATCLAIVAEPQLQCEQELWPSFFIRPPPGYPV